MRDCMFMTLLLSISLAIQPALADPWDPGDDSPVATTDLGIPGVDARSHGLHDLNAADVYDWFQFTLDAGVEYLFSSSGQTGAIGGLYAADGFTRLAEDVPNLFVDPDPNFQLLYVPEATAVYLLRVEALYPQSESTYTLHYTQVVPLSDAWDPGDDLYQGAIPLGVPGLDEMTHGPHSLAENDRYDWFEVTLEPGLEYEFMSVGDLDTAADLYFQNDEQRVASDDDRGENLNFRLLYHADVGGTYYLRVRTAVAGAEGMYAFTWRAGVDLLPEGDDWDHGDDIYEGANGLGAPVREVLSHGPHSLSESDPFDWFVFILSEGATYAFSAAGDVQPIADLFEDDGVTLALEDDTGVGFDLTDGILFTPIETSKYYLRIRDGSAAGGTYTVHYQLENEPTEPVTDEWDAGDDTPTGASDLGMPPETGLSHGMHSLSDVDVFDWYRFDLTAGETYEFWSSGADDTYGALYASDAETLLSQQDDGGLGYNFRVVYTPIESGFHYLRVQTAALGSLGIYGLHARHFVTPPETGDAWDPGDDVYTSASDLGVPITEAGLHGPHGLSSTDTTDWFRLTLQAGTAYAFSTSGESDTIGRLYEGTETDPIQPSVASGDDEGSGRNFAIQYVPDRDGVFFLRVTTFGTEQAVYTLHYRGDALPTSAVDSWALFR